LAPPLGVHRSEDPALEGRKERRNIKAFVKRWAVLLSRLAAPLQGAIGFVDLTLLLPEFVLWLFVFVRLVRVISWIVLQSRQVKRSTK
jgi:hypothetical protein